MIDTFQLPVVCNVILIILQFLQAQFDNHCAEAG